jgi:hypothetical protein
MSISANFPNLKPSFLADFANSQVLDSRITFSRSTTAPYYDGKTSVLAEQNLILQSQTFNTTWASSIPGPTVIANSTTAPDGTSTAYSLVTYNGSNGLVYLQQIVSSSVSSTFSIYAKANTTNYIGFTTANNGVQIGIDLSNGSITLNNGYTIPTPVSVGSGWYRISITMASLDRIRIFASTTSITASNQNIVGDGTSSVYIWGGQLEQRSSVTAYNATTTSAISNYIPQLLTAPINAPRFDFNPTTGESLGLLIEQSSTNLQTYSQDFTNAVWTKPNLNGTLTTASNIAPDGTQTVLLWQENNTATVQKSFYQSVSVTSGTSYTFSMYAKQYSGGSKRWLSLYPQSSATAAAVFDLLLGTVTFTSGANYVSSSITLLGNGMYRCTITFTAASTGSAFCNAYISNSGTAAAPAYTGDGFSGIYIWGSQLEALAFPTSYIPTTSAQVTRASDNASMTGTNFSSWYNPSAIAVLFQGSRKITSVSNQAFFQFGTGDFLALYSLSNNDQVYNQAVGVSGSVNTTLGATTLASKKIAMSYTAGAFQGAYNGTLGTAQTPANLPSNVSALYLGYTGSGSYLNGWIQKFAYYPQSFTSTNLTSLSGL